MKPSLPPVRRAKAFASNSIKPSVWHTSPTTQPPPMQESVVLAYRKPAERQKHVAIAPNPCTQVPHLGRGVDHVHIHRVVPAAASQGPKKVNTTPSTYQCGSVQNAGTSRVVTVVQSKQTIPWKAPCVSTVTTLRVVVAQLLAHKERSTEAHTCLTGNVQLAVHRRDIRPVQTVDRTDQTIESTMSNSSPNGCVRIVWQNPVRSGRPLAVQASADTWCQACVYPPCPGCGQQRPSNHKYHAQVMPKWTCTDCRAM